MNALFLTDLVAGNLPALAARVNNGECRFLAHDSVNAIDEQGFQSKIFAARTALFLPCSWSIQSGNDGDAGEKYIANQARGFIVYEIMIAKIIGVQAVDVLVTDRMELKLKAGAAEIKLLEVAAVINQNHSAWMILATETDAK